MAKQDGIIKLEGTIGDITFYKSKDGHLARGKGGLDASRIQNDAAFQRTMENGEEFGRAGSAGKLLRLAFRSFLQNGADSRMVSRLTKEMVAVVKKGKIQSFEINQPDRKSMAFKYLFLLKMSSFLILLNRLKSELCSRSANFTALANLLCFKRS